MKIIDNILGSFRVIVLISIVLTFFFGNYGILCAVLIVTGTIYIFNKIDVSHKKFLIALILISFMIKSGEVLLINNPQESDFKTMYDISADFLDGNVNEQSQNYMDNYNYQTPFILGQAFLLLICNSEIFIKFFNVFLSMLSLVLIYKISNRISDKKSAQIITTLYAFFINTILYNSVLSNQHIFSFIILLVFDLFFEEKIKNKFFKMFIVAVLLAIANLFRPESIIIIVSLICYMLYNLIVKKDNLKDTCIKFLILIATYVFFTQIPMLVLNKTGVIENKSITSSLYKVVIGLDYDSNGRWSKKGYDEYSSYTEKSDLRKYEIDTIKERVKTPRIFKLFFIKTNIFWNEFEDYWTLGYLNQEKFYDNIMNFITKYDRVLWLFMITLSIFGSYKNKNDEVRLYSIFISIIFLVYLLIEVQGRYAFPYRMFIFVLASLGLKKINKKTYNLWKIK